MKVSLVVISALLVLPWTARSADVDSTALVAEWDGGGISVRDLVKWWERIAPEERPALPSEEAKSEFLKSMINANLMLAAADSLGIPKHPDIVEWMRVKRDAALREELLAQAMAGRLEISDREIEEIYEKRLTQIEAGVPFEDLAFRHSTCPSGSNRGYLGKVRWGDFSERWSDQAFRLEPGGISQPFMVESGYAIIKAGERSLADAADPATERAAIRRTLEKRRRFSEIPAFRDSLRLAYQVDFDAEAVVDLCLRYSEKLLELGITSQIIEEDVIPDLTESEGERPVASYTGGSFTMMEVVNMILSQPYVVRPRLDDPDEMIPFVSRHLVDTLDVLEAEKRGIDKLPRVAIPLEKIRQRKELQYLFRYITRDIEVPEDVIRAYFEANAEQFAIEAGHTASKILVTTKAESDSIMGLLATGVAFEDIAREASLDPFSAPKGGDLGFLPLGKDQEFDGFFELMEVGDIEAFRSVEGFVILRLRERHERRIPDLEEVRDRVVRLIEPVYREEVLARWISDERARLGVKVNEALLGQLDLGA
jgi:peptidyl-prolyl cis-trans isomerase C